MTYSTDHQLNKDVEGLIISSGFTVLKFVDQGTQSLEMENGAALNEPTTYAVRIAIEQAVYEMILEGKRRGMWSFKDEK